MARLCFDYGHGGSDPGAIYKGRKESDDNLSIGMEVAKKLRCHGVEIDETRNKDITMSLKDRSSFANKKSYDCLISFHRNAFKPEMATGIEIFVYTRPSKKSLELANRIQKALVNVGFVDRGIKRANFHILRKTKAPVILIELGFIDNTKDNDLLDYKRNEIIRGISGAILDFYQV